MMRGRRVALHGRRVAIHGGRAAAVLICAAALSCRRAPRHIEIDMARFEAVAAERGDEALTGPQLESCFDHLFERIADLDLLPGLGKLRDRIEGDAALTFSTESFLSDLADSTAFQDAVAKLAREHPDDSDDELADRLENLADSATDGPAFDRAVVRGLDRLFTHPDLVRQFRRLDDPAGDAIRDAMRSRRLERELAKRLTQWNGGDIPGRDRATDLLLERVVTVERIVAFYSAVLALPAVEHQTQRAIAALSEKKTFGDLAVRRLQTLASDPELRRRARVIFEVLLASPDDAAALESAVVRALETPSVAQELSAFLDDLLASPDLAAVGQDALRNVTADAEFQRLVQAFLLGDPLPPVGSRQRVR